MKLVKLDISTKAREWFDTFNAKAGSEHIANLVALEAVLEILRDLKPRRVLDVGAGIGTLTALVLQYSDAEVVAIEDNEFCLGEFRKNVANAEERCTLAGYHYYPVRDYDLVLIDGGNGGHNGGYSGFTGDLLKNIPIPRAVFIEGKRFEQRQEARKALSKRTIYKTIKYEGESKGGYEIVPTRRGSPISRRAWQIYYEHIDWPLYRVVRRLKRLFHA